MTMSSPSRARRRLLLAIPCAMATGGVLASQLRPDAPRSAAPLVYRSWSYEVALTVDLFGEVSKPVVHTRHGERARISGVHDGKPWDLEFAISYKRRDERLNVIGRLSSDGEVLASRSVNAVAGQRVVLRADDAVFAAMIVKAT